MNKIEIELTAALIKLEQDVAKISLHINNSLSQALAKDMEEFKVVLFKLLMSNAEENE